MAKKPNKGWEKKQTGWTSKSTKARGANKKVVHTEGPQNNPDTKKIKKMVERNKVLKVSLLTVPQPDTEDVEITSACRRSKWN